jgi:Protein of unknown function (DUF3606)
MVDDQRMRSVQDRARINMGEDSEVHYWAEVLGVSKERLAEAVTKVGDSIRAVRQELGKTG